MESPEKEAVRPGGGGRVRRPAPGQLLLRRAAPTRYLSSRERLPRRPGPRPALAVWRGAGGREAGDVQMSGACVSPTCCCWRRGPLISAPLRPGRRHPSVSPRDLHSGSPTGSPAPRLGGRSRGQVGGGPPGSPASRGARRPLIARFPAAGTERSARGRPVSRLVAFVPRSDRTRHQGPPCVGSAAPPRLSWEGKLEKIGAPGM